MARNSSWSLHDYNVTRKLYAGYASTVCKVRTFCVLHGPVGRAIEVSYYLKTQSACGNG